jgi:hypothetical protein
MPSPAPDAVPAHIADLHPTQITLGLREVANKRLRWRTRLRRANAMEAPKLTAPVVCGGDGRLYLVDRHHLVRAVQLEGVETVMVRPIADFSSLSTIDFWKALAAKGWCHPYDASGRLRAFSEVPTSIESLGDDPYRSLASALRRRGGFSKSSKPFSEFAWADHLRSRVSREILANDFQASLELAMGLAGSQSACNLPGWKADLFDTTRIGRAGLAPHAGY